MISVSDPTAQAINLILAQLDVHDDVFHNIEDWAKELTAALNQQHEDISTAFRSVTDLVEHYERRINRLEDRVREMERR